LIVRLEAVDWQEVIGRWKLIGQEHKLNITNIDVRIEMDDEEISANWTQCAAF